MRLANLFRLRCPICGNAKLFRSYFDSPERCPSCGYFFMRETGYFLPHVPIGYAATVIVTLGAWPLLHYVIGIRSPGLTLGIMIAIAISFGVWSIRYAKAIWLALDLTLNPPHSDDFESRGRKS